MFLLPYRRFTIETPLGLAETLARLTDAVAPRRGSWFSSADPTKPFVGKLEDGRLDIARRISYRNSFLPQIRAEVMPGVEGTRITGTMKLHPAVAVFTVIWLCGALFGSVMTAPHVFEHGRLVPVALTPFGMVVFGVVLTPGAFIPEARKALDGLATAVAATRASFDRD